MPARANIPPRQRRSLQPAALLTSGANDGDASDAVASPSDGDASPSDGDASPNGDGASPNDGHAPTAPLEAGAVRPLQPLSRLDRHSFDFQLAAEEAAELLAQSRQGWPHWLQIQQPLSETVGVPWCPLVSYRA